MLKPLFGAIGGFLLFIIGFSFYMDRCRKCGSLFTALDLAESDDVAVGYPENRYRDVFRKCRRCGFEELLASRVEV